MSEVGMEPSKGGCVMDVVEGGTKVALEGIFEGGIEGEAEETPLQGTKSIPFSPEGADKLLQEEEDRKTARDSYLVQMRVITA